MEKELETALANAAACMAYALVLVNKLDAAKPDGWGADTTNSLASIDDNLAKLRMLL